MKSLARSGSAAAAIIIPLLFGIGTGSALAHCDTMDGPVVTLARKALDTGNPKPLLALIEGKIQEGIHKYYAEAMERKRHAGDSVEAGRAYVQAYVPLLHFVERLSVAASTPVAHGAGDVGGAGHALPEPAAAGKHSH
jgi:hypothetical protein